MQRHLLIIFGLIAITVAAFSGVGRLGFVNYDDDVYVTNNPHVYTGFSADNVSWAWKTFHASNYHPLVWLSLMLDVRLFGKGAAGFHWMNLAYHAANAVLVYLVFQQATGAVWRSALLAALFAVHPLRVESVAWISERKDVLSVFLGLLTMLAYVRFTRRLGWIWYLTTVVLFAATLFAKQSLITLPMVLLLLDYWPLQRWNKLARDAVQADRPQRSLPLLVLEKVPLLAMAAAISIFTVKAQAAGGAISSIAALPLSERLANVPVAYVRYLWKMIWFGSLAVFYPRHDWSFIQIMSSCLVLTAITAFCLWKIKSRPWLIVGLLWFLGVLVPMIGIVQVGAQSMADRYTYFSGLGIALMLTWSIPVSIRTRPIRITACVIWLLVLMVATFVQTFYWHDSVTLFRHDIAVAGSNYLAEANLGVAYAERRLSLDAVEHLEKAVRFDPTKARAQIALAAALAEVGKMDEAIDRALAAIDLQPTNASWHYRLAEIYIKNKDWDAAEEQCRLAIHYEQRMAEAHDRLGFALFQLGHRAEAHAEIEQALVLMPDLQMAKDDLKMLKEGSP